MDVTKVRFDRLEEAVRRLRANDLPLEWDFSEFRSSFRALGGCRTVGCYAGGLPEIDPAYWEVRPSPSGGDFMPWPRACAEAPAKSEVCAHLGDYYGIARGAAQHLFVAGEQDVSEYGGEELADDATRDEVAANIEDFIARFRPKEVAVG